jgi:hypothetical protein
MYLVEILLPLADAAERRSQPRPMTVWRSD